MNTKQVIVMRTDLGMRRGKQIAQGAHACLTVFLDRGNAVTFNGQVYLDIALWEECARWLEDSFTKVCVRVESEEELVGIYERAREAGLPCSLITDSGRTEFRGEPTKTCCAIGPAKAEAVDEITGKLKLL